MSPQTDLKAKLSFRIAPLLEMALSLLVLGNPERFSPPPEWAERVAGRLGQHWLPQLRSNASDIDFLALACEWEERGLSVPQALARLQEDDPELGNLLSVYWRVLAPELAGSAGILGESVQREAERLRAGDPLTYLCGFSDRVKAGDDGRSLVLEWGRGIPVALDRSREILLVPSTLCPRRLMFYRHGGMQIFFYDPLRREDEELPETPESLVLGFAALADATRLKLLRLIARGNIPAQEMAQQLGVHESTVSRHLKFLAEAGHVARERQQGKYILYSLNLERLDALTGTLREYVAGGQHMEGGRNGE